MQLNAEHPLNDGRTRHSNLVRSLRGERTSPLPVWFMRQAGRSLPEYREIRANVSMLDSCLTPDLVVEITMQPVRRHGVDAAILFSDIVIPLRLAGLEVEIASGIGPQIANPITTRLAFEELGVLSEDALEPIRTSVERLVEQLGETPLIGFGGAPFTLASYLIEGGPSKDLPESRRLMAEDPELWSDILSWCAKITAQFIRAQVISGASALQVFDSWAGKLSHDDYVTFAAPHTKTLFDELKDLTDDSGIAVPRIHFGVGTKAIHKEMMAVGATVLGVDYLTSLSDTAAEFDFQLPLQGNIDPDFLDKDFEELKAQTKSVIDEGKKAPGHVVNLGHGVPKDTDPTVLTKLVEYVHQITS